ncbi:MAG: hypothetical protein ACOYXR_06715 [Nitrospirota bacterium]
MARSTSDRESVQPVTTAVLIPVSVDSGQDHTKLTSPLREERGRKVQSSSLYTLHRQYRL